jgi:hypothetical protein
MFTPEHQLQLFLLWWLASCSVPITPTLSARQYTLLLNATQRVLPLCVFPKSAYAAVRIHPET